MIKQKDLKKGGKHSRSIRAGLRGQTPIGTSSGAANSNHLNGPDSLAHAIASGQQNRREGGVKSQVRGSMNGVSSLAAKQSKHDNFLRHVVMPPSQNQANGGGNKITDKLEADLKMQQNLRSINNFMSTEPIKSSQQANHHQVDPQHQSHQFVGNGQQSAVDLKNYEDRKKAVAAIYLNQMSNKMMPPAHQHNQSDSSLLVNSSNSTNHGRKVRRGSDTQLTGGAAAKHASSVTQQIDMGSLVGHRVVQNNGVSQQQRAASLNRSGYLYGGGGASSSENHHARQRSVTNNSFQGGNNQGGSGSGSGSHFKMRADYSAKRNSRGSSNHHTASHIPNASHNTYLKIGAVGSQQASNSNPQNQDERDPYQQVNQNSLVHERVKKQLSKYKTGSSSETHLRQASDGQINHQNQRTANRRDLSNQSHSHGNATTNHHYPHHSVSGVSVANANTNTSNNQNQNSAFVENPRLVRNLIHQQSHGVLQNGPGNSQNNQKSPLINSRKVFDPATYASQAQQLGGGKNNQSSLSLNQNSKREKSYSNTQIANNLYGVPSTLASSKGNLSSNQRHQKNLSSINLHSSNIQSAGNLNSQALGGGGSSAANQSQKQPKQHHLDQSDLLYQPSQHGYHAHSQSLTNATNAGTVSKNSSSTSGPQHKHAKLSTKLFKSLHQHHHSSHQGGSNILSQTQTNNAISNANANNMTHSYQTASVSSLQNTKDQTLNNSQNVGRSSKRTTHAYLEVKDSYQNQPKSMLQGSANSTNESSHNHSHSLGRLQVDQTNANNQNSSHQKQSATSNAAGHGIVQSASSGQILSQQSGQQLFHQLRPNFAANSSTSVQDQQQDHLHQHKVGGSSGSLSKNQHKNIQIIKKPAARLHKPSLSSLGRDLTSNTNKEQFSQQQQNSSANEAVQVQAGQIGGQHQLANASSNSRLFNSKAADQQARNGPQMQQTAHNQSASLTAADHQHLNSLPLNNKLKTDSQFLAAHNQSSSHHQNSDPTNPLLIGPASSQAAQQAHAQGIMSQQHSQQSGVRSSSRHANSAMITSSQQQQRPSSNRMKMQQQSSHQQAQQQQSSSFQSLNAMQQRKASNSRGGGVGLGENTTFEEHQFQTHDSNAQSQAQSLANNNLSSSMHKSKKSQHNQHNQHQHQVRSLSQSELKNVAISSHSQAQPQASSLKQRSVDAKNFYSQAGSSSSQVVDQHQTYEQNQAQQPYINLENTTNRSSKFSRHSRQRTSQQPSIGGQGVNPVGVQQQAAHKRGSQGGGVNGGTAQNSSSYGPPAPVSTNQQQQTGNHNTHDFENFNPGPPQNVQNSNAKGGPIEGFLVVKQFGQASMAGNVGRTASAKTNQDSLFITKIGFDNSNNPSKNAKTKNSASQQPPQQTSEVDWFVAVADGHGANGHFVSQYIAQHLPKQYETDKRKLDKQTKNAKGGDLSPAQKILDLDDHEGLSEAEKNERRIKRALVSSYLNTQQKLEKQSQFDVQLSGSTVVGCYCHQNTLIFANAGDSRAIFIGQQQSAQNSPEYMNERGGGQFDNSLVILAQTRDHKPDLEDEADRILNHYDGQINNTHAQTLVIQAIQGVNSVAPPKPSQKFGPPRVWVHNQTYPGLAMSRSLGDALAKKAGVVAEPEISHYKYDPELVREIPPRFIVLASDGVWDVMSNEQVATMCCDPRNANKSAQKLAEMLLKTSRQRWLIAPANQGVQSEQYADIDDISVVVLKMDFQITSQ